METVLCCVTWIELIIVHLRGQSHFQGRGAIAPLVPPPWLMAQRGTTRGGKGAPPPHTFQYTHTCTSYSISILWSKSLTHYLVTPPIVT